MIADLQGVGKNYQDHGYVGEQVLFDNTEAVELLDAAKAQSKTSLLQYLFRGKGKPG